LTQIVFCHIAYLSLSHTHTHCDCLSLASAHLHRPIRICETRRPSPTPPERTVRILELQPCFRFERGDVGDLSLWPAGALKDPLSCAKGPASRKSLDSTSQPLDTGAKKSLPPKVLPSARLSSRFQHSQTRMRQGFLQAHKKHSPLICGMEIIVCVLPPFLNQ
jgi:hypothetical protein